MLTRRGFLKTGLAATGGGQLTACSVAFTLHCTWLPEPRSRAAPAYLVDRAQDHGERLASLPADAPALARPTLGL